MIDINNIDWRYLSESQQQQLSSRLAKTANARLDYFDKRGLQDVTVRYTRDYLKRNKQRRFKTGKLQGYELREQLIELSNFFNMRTSTMSGYKEVMKEVVSKFEEETGTDIADKEGFYRFIHSQQFKQLSKTIDSDFLIEDSLEVLDNKYTIDEIQKQYEKHMTDGLTLNQIQKLRETAWKK